MTKTSDVFQLLEGGAEKHREGVDSSGTVESGQSEQALLQAGKITVDEFIDMTIDRALSHLQGQVDEERLLSMREILRLELLEDPYLRELVDQSSVSSS